MTTGKNSARTLFSTSAPYYVEGIPQSADEYIVRDTDYVGFSFELDGKSFKLFLEMPKHKDGPLSYLYDEPAVILATNHTTVNRDYTVVFSGTFREFWDWLFSIRKGSDD